MRDEDIAGASRPTRRLLVATWALWAVLALALPLAALTLNVVQVAGFPLGFWVAAQGAFIGLAALALFFAWRAGGERGSGGAIDPLVFAGECIGSAGFLGFAGLIAQYGFDALSYPLGIAAGLAAIAILIAPRFVLYPAATFSGFLNARFSDLKVWRVVFAVLFVASVFLLAADIRGLGLAVEALTGAERTLAFAAAATLISVIWLASAPLWPRRRLGLAFVGLLVAFSIPLITLALVQHRLPLPYWSYGFALQDVATREQALLMQKLADFRALKPLASPFLQLSPWNFAGIVLAVALGLAALPQILGRHISRAVVGAGGASRRAAVAAVLAGIFLCGLAPFATLTRAGLAELLQTPLKTTELPSRVSEASGRGWIEVCGSNAATQSELAAACAKASGQKGLLRLQDIAFTPDTYVFAASELAGIEGPMWMLLVAGAALAALVAGHAILSGFLAADAEARGLATGSDRQLTPRSFALAALLMLPALYYALASPLELASMASDGLAIVAAALFPVLVLALYWRRFNSAGAITAALAGFLVTGLYIAGVRFFPATFVEWTLPWTNAAPGAIRKIMELQAAVVSAATPEVRADAHVQLYRQAAAVAGLWGLRPAASVLFAIPTALLAGALATLVTSSRRGQGPTYRRFNLFNTFPRLHHSK